MTLLPDRDRRAGPPGTVAVAGLFFLVATLLMTWPLATDPGHLISDPYDPLLNTWILHWDWKQTFHDPLHLYDANIFHPSRLTLAFSENLIGVAVFGFPLFFAGCSPVTVYSVLFLLGMFLSGVGAWALAREMSGDGGAALLAGILYEFVPFRFDHLAHIQIQWGGFLPLCLLFLWRYFRTRKTRDLAWFSVFFAWNALANVHYGIFGALAVALMSALELTRRQLWRQRDVLGRLGTGLISAAAVVGPFYAPYLLASRRYGFRRTLGEAMTFSARPAAFLSAGQHSKMYGALTARFDAPECQLFPGFVVPALAVLGLFLLRHRRPANAPPADKEAPRRKTLWLDSLILGLFGLRLAVAFTGGFRFRGILSLREPFRLSMLIAALLLVRCALALPPWSGYRDLGDFLRRSPWRGAPAWALAMIALGVAMAGGARFFFYRELYEVLPTAFGAIRAPARSIVLGHLGLGILAATGVSHWSRCRKSLGRMLIPSAVSLAALLELRAAPLSLFRSDTRVLPVSSWLAVTAFPGGVLELPMKMGDNVDYVYRTTEHGHPILNGYSGFFPPDFLELDRQIGRATELAPIQPLLRRLDASVVVFHSGRATREELRRLPGLLQSGIDAGLLEPVAFFVDPREKELVFQIAGSAPALASPDQRALAREKTVDFLRHPDRPRRSPVGWYDSPRNGEVFSGLAVTGTGWAASDSGIARVVVDLDGHQVGDATYGIERHDVPSVKPDIPCGAFCGYRFRIAGVSPGQHTLSVRFVGRDGRESGPPFVRIKVAQ